MKNKNKGHKQDNSPKIQQNGKIQETLNIKEFPWTEKQKKFIEIAKNKDTKIIICKSPPGCGKTLLSVFCCLELLNKKSISDIVFYRNPIESASKSLGYLGGSYEEKISAYGQPLNDHLNELLDKATINKLFAEKRISLESIGFAKGCTHHAKGVILEESEDLTIQELELIFGRMGRFSKLFVIGDERQANIRNSGFTKVFNAFNTEQAKNNGIYCLEFTKEDCMRNSILKFIIEIFEKIN